jgi:hypothetical protein
MFQILRARAENDSAKDAFLTQALRFVILSTSLYLQFNLITGRHDQLE